MISIDRGLIAVARGNVEVPSRFSTSITGTPYSARPMAVTSPAGPAPTTSAVVVRPGDLGHVRELHCLLLIHCPEDYVGHMSD